jgi:hypothetical protein
MDPIFVMISMYLILYVAIPLCYSITPLDIGHPLINRVLSLISLFELLCENDNFEGILLMILEIIIQ